MSYWKTSEINLGVIKEGTPKKVIFEALENIPKISKIYAYCGCTDPKYDEEKKELSVIYNNKKMSFQVKGSQSITKRIDITYETGETEVLVIKATKTR
jgi:hypothetical protein